MAGRKGDGRGMVRVFGAPQLRVANPEPGLPVEMSASSAGPLVPLAPQVVRHNPDRALESLSPVQLDPAHLSRNNLFPVVSSEPAVAAMDILRGSLLQGLKDKGWHRVGVTSPTHGCGKSFVAANLALSLARRPGSRTALLDLDLRRPRLAAMFGLEEELALPDFLSARQPMEALFRRLGKTLALGLNHQPVETASELLHSPDTRRALDDLMREIDPEVMVLDLPPVLVCDDVLALSGAVDCVLLVTDATRSTPEEIRATESMLEGRTPLLGVVLNRGREKAASRYGYGRE